MSQKEKSSSATLPWIRCVRAFITTSCVDGDSELEKERKSLRAAIIADPAIQLSNVLGPPAYATPEWARYAGWEFYPFPKSRSDTSQTSLVEDRTPVCRDKRLGPVLFAGDRICLRRTDTENHSWYDAFASQVLRSSADSVDLCEIDLLEFHPILQNPKEGGCIPCEKVVWSDTRKRILLRVPEREGGTLHTSSQPLKACYVFRMGLRYTEPFHLLPRGKLLIQYPKKEPLYNTIVVSEAELTLSVQLSFLYRAYRNWVGSRAMISVEYRSASTTYSPIPNIALRFSHASLSRRHRVIRSFPSNHKVPLKQIMSRFSTYAEKGLAKSTQYEDFPEHQWELLLPSKELRSGWYRVVFHGVDLLEAPIEDNGFLPPAVPKTYSEDFFIRNQAEKLEEVVFLSPEPQPVPLLLSSTAFLSAEKQLPVYFEEEMINVTWTKGERLTKCGLAIKAGLPTNDESRAAISWLASAVTVSKETSTSISSSAIQTLALAAKKTENVFHFYMNCTERSGGRFSFRYAPRSYFVYSTPFLILRNSDARSWLKQNLDSENQFHSALARLRHRAIQSGLRTDIMDRCCAWRRLLKYENTVTWPIGYTESLMEATTSVQIKKDLSRCRYGNTTDLKQQDDLWFIMKQVFSNDHEASYYQGLNEVALVPYLLCSKDDAIPLMHLLKKYWIRPHLTHGMKFTQALYRLVHPLVEYRNPIVARHIEASGHMEGNYAMAWIATLFATAYDKGPVHVVGRFFDFFFATDPLFMPVYLSASMMLHARLELDRTYDTILRQSNQLGLEDPEMFHMYQTILAVPHLYGTDEVNELYAAGQNSELLEAALHTAHDLYRSCPPQRLMLYSSGRNPCLNISLITSQVEQGLTPPVSSEIADLYVSTDQMDELTNEVVFENTRFLLDVSFVSHEGTGSSTDRTSGSPVKEIVGGTRNADSDRENVSTPADDETTSGILFTTAARIARYTSYIFRDVNVGPDSSTHPRSTGHMLDIDALERILRTEAEDELHHLRSMGAQFSDAMQEVIQRLRVKLQRAYAHLFNRLRWAPHEYRELRVTPFLSAEMSSLPSPAREIIISLTPEVLIGALEDAFRKEGEEWNHFQSEDTSDDESSVKVPSTDSSGNTAENTPVGSLRGRQLRLHVTSGTLFQIFVSAFPFVGFEVNLFESLNFLRQRNSTSRKCRLFFWQPIMTLEITFFISNVFQKKLKVNAIRMFPTYVT